ncbi:MFS transporter [Desulfovulcanus ferrireducens]|uniref:MFS transporter n=1 Tax=Desulfovulcanus ferrireducens TaxID=2831190 RepID=UPI00207BCFDD|nr:MFS transporter [Desulfovulcanus ferrireducens]
MYLFLLVLTITTAAGFQGWRTLFNNFSVEVVGINGQQMGILQSIREIPGFLALLVIYLLFLISEHRLAALSVIFLGVGVGLTGLLPSFAGLIFTTLLMSFGFHYYETLNQSLTLQYFDYSTAPIVLGRLRAVYSATNIAIGVVIFILAKFLNYTQMFICMGGLVVVGGLWAIIQDPSDKNLPVQHKKMILRSRYWLFYALTFMAGARRQIFMAFAVFLLVKRFNFTVQEVTVLFIINNVLNYFASPLIGKAINRFGERKVLSLEYLALIFIFLTYAFTESKWVAGIMYILDFIFFNFSIAIKSYFQKIAHPKDIGPSMAVGFTINHIVAVIVPVVGGILWMTDYRIPFFMGAGMSIVSLILVQFIKNGAMVP